MQTIVLSCRFGAVGAMAVWAAVSARASVVEILRRSDKLHPFQRP